MGLKRASPVTTEGAPCKIAYNQKMDMVHSRRQKPPHASKIMRGVLTGFAVAQTAAVVAVHAVDRVRKARVPGGVTDFPTLPPSDTEVDNCVIRTYVDGVDLYADMLEAIRAAEEFIYFETYVWRADAIGQQFKEALYEAADRGVEVFVIYDGFGTLNQSPRFKHFPKHPNMHVIRLPILRKGIVTFNLRDTGRTHRKTMVVDDDYGFVGGFNIGVDFGHEWRDTHVRVTGRAVEELSDGYANFWNYLRRRRQPSLAPKFRRRWNPPISAAFNLPSRLLFPVRGLYLDAFSRAQKQILITTAYFIPDREILTALKNAAGRGVEVRVLIPEYSNHILADWVARPYLGQLLRAGVEIWAYQHAMMHSKTMTVDGVWSTVGTANIDRLSLRGNFEVNLQIYSAPYAAQMEKIFVNDLTTSRQITLQEWESRSWLVKIGEFLLRPYAAIV